MENPATKRVTPYYKGLLARSVAERPRIDPVATSDARIGTHSEPGPPKAEVTDSNPILGAIYITKNNGL